MRLAEIIIYCGYYGYYGYRTEELGEDDISFKMINENASLVPWLLTGM